jgi:peroxiredoxin
MKAALAAAALAVLAGIAGCAGGGGDQISYVASDLRTGDEVSVASLRGAPALLVSWTTWCAECDEELSGLQTFAASPLREGIEIIAVNLDASASVDEIEAKIADHGLTTGLWRDRRNEFKATFGALGVPTTVLLDADGVVVDLFPGAVDFGDEAVIAALDKVRAEKP